MPALPTSLRHPTRPIHAAPRHAIQLPGPISDPDLGPRSDPTGPSVTRLRTHTHRTQKHMTYNAMEDMPCKKESIMKTVTKKHCTHTRKHNHMERYGNVHIDIHRLCPRRCLLSFCLPVYTVRRDTYLRLQPNEHSGCSIYSPLLV